MYFHVVWIKEKNWNKYDLDILIKWWDEESVRKFLSNRWVVIVSIEQFKDDSKSFWNIVIIDSFENTEIEIIIKWDDLWEMVYFIMFLWLKPSSVNYIENPVSEEKMNEFINSTSLKIEEEEEKVKQEKELEELKEQKKYEEAWIKDWLKIINANIVRIEQTMKAWEGVISWSEMKELENYLNEMKKIRLWTNFNKMAALVLDVHILLRKAEEEIFNQYNDKKFLVDNNSYATNIDIFDEYFKSSRISEKAVLQPAWLTIKESISNVFWSKMIFIDLLNSDTRKTFEDTSIDDILDIVLNLVEYIALCAIITVVVIRLFAPFLWYDKFSLYLLPAMWWLWLLLYLLNNLKLSWIIRIVWFAVVAFIYWQWLVLLLNTFAL